MHSATTETTYESAHSATVKVRHLGSRPGRGHCTLTLTSLRGVGSTLGLFDRWWHHNNKRLWGKIFVSKTNAEDRKYVDVDYMVDLISCCAVNLC